jgi:hypothetical protein
MTLSSKLHTSSNSATIEDDDTDLFTPKVPRGRRSDLTEKDLEEFTYSFSAFMTATAAGYLE